MKKIIAFFSALTISALLAITAFADELPPYSPERLVRDSDSEPVILIIAIAAAVAAAITAVCVIKYVKKKKSSKTNINNEEKKES